MCNLALEAACTKLRIESLAVTHKLPLGTQIVMSTQTCCRYHSFLLMTFIPMSTASLARTYGAVCISSRYCSVRGTSFLTSQSSLDFTSCTYVPLALMFPA